MELRNPCESYDDRINRPEQYYMGARPYTEKNLAKLPWDTGVLVQDKIDGVYLRVHVLPDGTKEAFLRSGRPVDWTLLKGLNKAISNLPVDLSAPYFIEGDVVASYEKTTTFCKREQTAGFINTVTKSGYSPEGVEFHLWMWFKGKPGDSMMRGTESAISEELLQTSPWLWSVVTFLWMSGPEWIEEYAKEKVEYGQIEDEYGLVNAPRDGVVCKDPDQVWIPGKPAGCVKVKPWKSCAMEVTAVTKHTKRADMFGALVCRADHAGDKVIVNVGSGLTDNDRLKPSDYWVGKTVLVEYEDTTEPNAKGQRSLTLPRFKGII